MESEKIKRNCKTCIHHKDTPFGLLPRSYCPTLTRIDLLAYSRDEDMECLKWEGM